MTLAPSVVRKIILDEHAVIRTKLDAIEKLVGSKHDQAVKNAVDEFTHYFLKHIATEEKILRPVLADLDGWGEVRVEKMNKEHKEQTAELKRLNALVQGKNFEEYEAGLRDFVQSIYTDMEQEESDILSPGLLKDDVITAGDCS